MNKRSQFLRQARTGELIHYWRLKYGSVLEPDFVEGEARIVVPARGLIITGTLVDCPEDRPDFGWIIIDTPDETVAAGSSVFRMLMIENDPCELELVAVPIRGHTGRLGWDWEVYELSPNGPRILVSEPQGEPRVQQTAPGRRKPRLQR